MHETSERLAELPGQCRAGRIADKPLSPVQMYREEPRCPWCCHVLVSEVETCSEQG